MKIRTYAIIASFAALCAPSITVAQSKEPPELAECEEPIGTIAVVEGSTAGWNEWGLGTPRALINSLAIQSGCFTPHAAQDGTPADFLLTTIAGSQEEVDQGVEAGKAVASEALLRTGVAGQALSKVPLAGSVLGMFGGLGGRKKTVAAGITVVSPSNGQTITATSGSVKKSRIKFRRDEYSWAATAAGEAGYADSKDGRMLTEAFTIAFNQLVEQRALLENIPLASASEAADSEPKAVVAVDTVMRAGPSADTEEVRSLRAGTELTPTGNREGLFIEAQDNYGTTGWVSVEDLG